MARVPEQPEIESSEKINNSLPVVGVGASAGGLAAFKEFIEGIPEESGMAYVLVQHLDPTQASILPQLLQKNSKLPVHQITDQLEVEPDNIYIIPSNTMLISRDGVLQLSPRPPRKDKIVNLPIDLFFESLATVYKAQAIGVVLTGSGSDGTAGLKAIKEQGGITFAQAGETAEFSSMPNSAVQEGVVDFIFPPREIPGKILEVVNNLYGKDADDLEKEDHDIYRQILALLRIRKGADFTYYRQTTIRRRIMRRMGLVEKKDPEDYLFFLKENRKEQDALYQDLLIPVTEFFRDKQIFENLCENIVPQILKNKKEDDRLRVWVAACSTGQEVYSIAMCLLEAQELSGEKDNIHIFGTDISEPAIAKARLGKYSEAEMENISPERINKFFTKIDNKYQVKKEIRELCVFSCHNFLKDPPFGKMDLISCRNVLIYLQPYLQKKVLTTFHYALKKDGYLLLGKSESTGNAPDLFDSSQKKYKIFTPRDKPRKFMQVTTFEKEESYRDFGKTVKNGNARTDFERVADEVILSKYTPPGLVVDDELEIVHFRGRTGSYLEPQAGKPNLNLLRMAKPGLAFELRNIVHQARKEGGSVLRENILLQDNDVHRFISIEAIPLPNLTESYYLILFHDPTLQPGSAAVNQPVLLNGAAMAVKDKIGKNLLIRQLEKELAQAREDMRTITEDQEATNEELQSANEELQSGSEELQTLNEELETSKEELQSTNEELISLNQELMGTNRNLKAARNYAVDIMETIREPWVVLNKDLNVKTGNKAFYKVFRTSEEKIRGRSVLNLGNKQWFFPELEKLLHKVLTEKAVISDYEITQEFPVIGERTMLINAREIIREDGGEELILLVFGDITDKRMAERSLEKSEIKFKLLADTIPQLIWISNAAGKFEYFNSKWRQYTGQPSGEDLENSLASFVHEDDRDRVMQNWKQCLKTGDPFSMEYRLKGREGTYNWFLVKALPLFSTNGEIMKWFGSYTNIENQKEAETALLKSREHFRRLAELVPEKISQADALGRVKYFNKSWIDYTGLSRRDLIDFNWSTIIHDDDREKVNEKWNHCVDKGKNFEVEIRLLNQKGEYKWHLSRAVPIKDEDGKVKHWISATTEIEKFKEEEKRKEGFLQLVSHELKTPITSIKGYVQLLLTLLHREDDPAFDKLPIKPSLARIDDQIARLTRLISEMLDLSRIEENKLELKQELFSLNDAVTETIQDINRTKIEHFLSIDHRAHFSVNGDKDRIEQVIINLVTNAIKYSPVNKNIEVTVFETEDKKAAVSIADHGIGIAETEQEHVFKRFHRVAGKSEETYAGLGIGLFLAHQIVERHGGELNVKSTLGEGSVFTFTLPYEVVNSE